MTSSDTVQRMQNQLGKNSGAHSLLEVSMGWMDGLYDSAQGLLRHPNDPDNHMVRESLWYALGLLLESQPGKPDARQDRFERIVSSVLANHYDAPGKIYHGTFKRAPREPDPPVDAVIWQDYDPNWRQFIGTILLLLRRLEGHQRLASQLPAIDTALALCIQGEPEDRVPPTYTNIALMKAWLEVEHGDLIDGHTRQRGLSYAAKINEAFNQHKAFSEYNSPTYYGINFFALGLWQNFSDDLAGKGREINTILWTDVARFYHPGMKNLCGPWSRSYGMNMQDYVAALGLWIWSATSRETAPFPSSTSELVHGHDFCLGPIAAFSAVAIPAEVKEHFSKFGEPRNISQQISIAPFRKAEAYLSQNLMIGLESSTKSFHGTDQYHPLTIHWCDTKARVNWSRLRFRGSLFGELEANKINLKLTADDGVKSARLEFSHAIQISGQTITSNGLTLHFEPTYPLEAEGNCLTINLPDFSSEYPLAITCDMSEGVGE